MGWLREGRREGGDEGFLGVGVLDVEDGLFGYRGVKESTSRYLGLRSRCLDL